MTTGHRRRVTIAGAIAGFAALLLALAPAAPAAARPRTAPSLVARAVPGTTTATTMAPATTTTISLPDPFTPVTTAAPSPSPAATAHVAIVDFGYGPSSITVTAGTTVVWTNTGQSIHSVTSDTGAFDSSPSCPTGPCIDPGATFSHTFGTPGTFAYHCRVHSNMHGTVIVEAEPSATTTTVAGAPTTAAPGVTAGGSPSPSTTATGAQLAFTGSAPAALWLTFGALLALAADLALRPRRRPFPIPIENDRHPSD